MTNNNTATVATSAHVATDTDAATTRVSDALAAVESIDAVLTRATVAGNAVIAKAYGADTPGVKRDPRAAVRLARAVARDITGAAKAKGKARAQVLAVLAALSNGDAPADAVTLVTLARTVLDADAAKAKAARKAESEKRAALTSVVNDRTAALADRIDAITAKAAMEGESDHAKAQARFDALNRALTSAHDAGITYESILSAVNAVYGK